MVLVARFAHTTLGLPPATSARTVLLGLAFILLGLPWLGMVLEAGTTALLGAGIQLGLAAVAALGLFMRIVLSFRGDQRRAADRSDRLRSGQLRPRAALVYLASLGEPSDGLLDQLEAATRAERLRILASSPPRWCEALARQVEYHAQHLQRLVLLHDPSKRESDALRRLERLARLLVDTATEHHAFLELRPLNDLWDAEWLRVQAMGILERLLAEGYPSEEVVVDLTGGTAAWSSGAVLAASFRDIDVSYLPQISGPIEVPSPDGKGTMQVGFGLLPHGDPDGVPGLLPLRVYTDEARRLWSES